MPRVPRLVLQGDRDTFGSPDEIRAAVGAEPLVTVVDLPGADHGFRVAKAAAFSAADLRARVVAAVDAFVGSAASARQPGQLQ
jgi:predicted alpha/beta-hydrolase family hydrolase